MMEKNKLTPIFFVAFRDRLDGDITIIYPNGKQPHFDSKVEAQTYFDELIQNKSYSEADIEVIRLWKTQTL